jgi:hypothetical protein
MKIILIAIAIIFLCVVILAIIGYIHKRKERQYLTKFNEESIQSFMDGQENRRERRKAKKKSLYKLKK